jgi:putative flippase GtrA
MRVLGVDPRSVLDRGRMRVRSILGGVPAPLGALLAPDSGLRGQGARFVLAGCAVTAVYLTTTTTLAVLFGVPFEVALAIGFFLALILHFTLQRTFVWVNSEEFALPFRRQVGRYLLVAGSQYAVTAASVTLLPAALGLPAEVVYLAAVALTTSANFVVFRNGVFHATSGSAAQASAPVAKIA